MGQSKTGSQPGAQCGGQQTDYSIGQSAKGDLPVHGMARPGQENQLELQGEELQAGDGIVQSGQENQPKLQGSWQTFGSGGEEMDGMRLEEVLAQVEGCIAQLENPQVSLEDSFRYYEEGVRKLKICSEKVAQIERKMLVVNSQGELEAFQ